MLSPLLLIVLSPSWILFKPLRFLFKRIVNVSDPLAVTAILPLAETNAASSVADTPSPCTFTKEPSLCLFTVPVLLPVNFKPSSIVATS